MIQLRKQLGLAAIGAWILWIVLSMLEINSWAAGGGSQNMRVVVSGLTTVLLWLGLAFAASCVMTHVLIVRDEELNELLGDDACCGDGNCCQPKD